MEFAQLCVGIVITVGLALVSGGAGCLSTIGSNDDTWVVVSWMISTIGFGICLTILLFQNGLIS